MTEPTEEDPGGTPAPDSIPTPVAEPVATATEVPATAQPAAKKTRRWKGWHVVFFSVLTALIVLALLIELSSGGEFFHYGRSGCLFVHDRFSHMHFQCGTNLVAPGG